MNPIRIPFALSSRQDFYWYQLCCKQTVPAGWAETSYRSPQVAWTQLNTGLLPRTDRDKCGWITQQTQHVPGCCVRIKGSSRHSLDSFCTKKSLSKEGLWVPAEIRPWMSWFGLHLSHLPLHLIPLVLPWKNCFVRFCSSTGKHQPSIYPFAYLWWITNKILTSQY